MSGAAWALGAAGALAVAGLARPGSRNLPVGRSVTIQVMLPNEIRAAYRSQTNPCVAWPSFRPEDGVRLVDPTHGDLASILAGFDGSDPATMPTWRALKIWEALSALPATMQKLRFPLRVYRGLRLRDPTHLDLGIPGLHWTPNKRIATHFATGRHDSAHVFYNDEGKSILLTGVIERPEDVNWQRTLTDWLVYTAGNEGIEDVAEEQIHSGDVRNVAVVRP